MRRITPILAGLLAACTSSTAPWPLLKLDPPGEVTLSVGQSVELISPAASPLPLLITFVEVSTDSRCPDLVQCIWAGDAAVRLDISGQATGTLVLHTPTEEIGPMSGMVGPYRVTVVNLTAAAVGPHPRPRSDLYRLTLRVGSLPVP